MTKKVGKPRHVPTSQNRNDVKLMVARGCTSVQMASHIGISKDTLHKYYQTELDTGRVSWHNLIFSALALKIKEGDTSAIIFACKTQLGFSEKYYFEHSQVEQKKERTVDEVLKQLSEVNSPVIIDAEPIEAETKKDD